MKVDTNGQRDRRRRVAAIGLLTCGNATRLLDCPVGGCIDHLQRRKGEFARYGEGAARLVGVSSCGGCPTLVGEEAILAKVEGLKHYGATHIHLAYCMTTICPFIGKYRSVIERHHPEITLVLGSHEPGQEMRIFRDQIRELLRQRRTALIP